MDSAVRADHSGLLEGDSALWDVTPEIGDPPGIHGETKQEIGAATRTFGRTA